MKLRYITYIILLIITHSFSNLNDGLQKGQKILFVRLASQAVAGPQNMNWVAEKLNVHHKVTQSTTIPANLTAYDQVWDIRWANSNTRVLSDAEITNLQNFMKNDSGSVFILGENRQFDEVNNPLIKFVNSVTKKGGFAVSGIGYVGNSGSGFKNTVTINTVACDSAENFDTDHQTGWSKVWTEVPGTVLKTEMAGGFSVLEYGSNWAGAVAWTHDRLKDQYSGGKLFTFFDSQAFHCWASTQWGMSAMHKNNLKFFWNISDFLSKTIPEATLTANPAGGEFNTYSIDVSLFSNADSIIYSINSSDTLAYDGNPITISGDTIILWAKALGSNVLPKEKTWTFYCDLPEATLTADPGTIGEVTTFAKSKQLVTITSGNSSDTIAYTVFHEDGNIETGLFIGSGSVTINGDDTISVLAYGDLIDSTTASWYYKKELPTATITATPSNTLSFKYTTQFLDITLETEENNQLVYQIISENDTTDWDTTSSNIETIKISGDVTVNAITIGSEYLSGSGSWTYSCELPTLEVKANPNDTSFQKELTINLWAKYLESTVDAEIKYIIDSLGIGHTASDVNEKGITYNSSGLTISKSVTIYAIVVDPKGDYAEGFAKFNYELDLLDPVITVTPSQDPVFYFGYTIDSINIFTDADSLKWILSNSMMDSLEVYNKGNSSQLITNAIKSTDPDEMYLTVLAYGNAFEPTLKTFKYKRQYLPAITADKFDPAGFKFVANTAVKLSIEDSLKSFENVKIHYIITSDSSAAIDSSGKQSSTALIDSTVYIKAIAYCDNAISSPVFKGFYIRVIGTQNAWYKDCDANGSIDQISIKLTEMIDIVPEELTVVNPFNKKDTITISDKNLFDLKEDRLIVNIPETSEFIDLAQKSTYFEEGPFAKLAGQYYSEDFFTVADSLPPLINEAVFQPGAITKVDGKIIRETDMLIITFSENIKLESFSKKDKYFNLLKTSTGQKYSFDLEPYSSSGTLAYFKVIDLKGNYPFSSDSIRIDTESGITATEGDIMQTVEENRYCSIRVLPVDVKEEINTLSPVDPTSFKIPMVLNSNISHGLAVIIDFIVVLSEDIQSSLDAQAVIYDHVGNMVASINGMASNNKNIGVYLSNSDRTRLSIVWNGINTKGRLVSPGQYRMLINYTGSDGKTREVKMIFIGIIN